MTLLSWSRIDYLQQEFLDSNCSGTKTQGLKITAENRLPLLSQVFVRGGLTFKSS